MTTGAVTSDATGLAALDAWILGAVAGTNNNTLDAALTSDAAVKKTFIASATPGPASAIGKALPTHGVADNGDNQTAVAGTTLPKPGLAQAIFAHAKAITRLKSGKLGEARQETDRAETLFKAEGPAGAFYLKSFPALRARLGKT